MQIANQPLLIERRTAHLEEHLEIKDPSLVKVSDNEYYLFASIGNSVTQRWQVGRFQASDPTGKWTELAPAYFTNLNGPQLCAPAVTYQQTSNRQPSWEMYIQTACFEEDGQIVRATSTDGQHFVGQSQPVVTRADIADSPQPVVGVYDVAISEVQVANQELLCLLYSGYRQVGCGDIYASYKPKTATDQAWSKGQLLLAQEQVPFHNAPRDEHFEWGLEGAKLIQLAADCFVLIGVCFLPQGAGASGTRQRVFLAAASQLSGPYLPLGLPFRPSQGQGENGHPDTLIEGNQLWVIYQERRGDGQPWYLRQAVLDLPSLESFVRGRLTAAQQPDYHQTIAAQSPDSYHFHFAC